MDNLGFKLCVVMMISAVMAVPGFCQGQDVESYYKYRENDLRLRAEDQMRQITQAENARLLQEDLIRKESFFDDNKFLPDGTLLSKEDIALSQQRLDDANQNILQDLNADIAKLESQKKYVLEAEFAPRVEVQLPPHTVSGIVYSSDKATAALDGIIFSDGDTVKNVRVVKIYKDKVEFARNGNRWTQGVGEPPKDFWNK